MKRETMIKTTRVLYWGLAIWLPIVAFIRAMDAEYVIAMWVMLTWAWALIAWHNWRACNRAWELLDEFQEGLVAFRDDLVKQLSKKPKKDLKSSKKVKAK